MHDVRHSPSRPPDDPPSSPVQRRKLFALAQRFGLTRDERLELAEMVLRREVPSWGGLSRAEAARMIDTLEGFELVAHILLGRQRSEGHEWTKG